MSREQRLRALESANERRVGRAHLRRALRAGEVSMVDVLLDPPECVGGTLLFDLLLMDGFFGPGKLRRLNLRAMAAGVNLAVPVGVASERSLRWLAGELSGDRVAA